MPRHAEEGSPFLVDEGTLVSASVKIGGSSSSGEARARKASFAGIFVATVMLGVLFVLSSQSASQRDNQGAAALLTDRATLLDANEPGPNTPVEFLVTQADLAWFATANTANLPRNECTLIDASNKTIFSGTLNMSTPSVSIGVSSGDAAPISVELSNHEGQAFVRKTLIKCYCDRAVQASECMQMCENPLDDLAS